MELFRAIFADSADLKAHTHWADEMEAQARAWHSLLLIGAFLVFPLWGLFDYVLVREHWQLFVGLRLADASLALCLLILQSYLRLPSKVSAYLISMLLFGSLSFMLALSGEAYETYSLSLTAAFVGVSLFLFWEIPHSIINYLLGLALYFGMSYTFGHRDLGASLVDGGFLHITVALFGVLIIAARLSIAKREFHTRKMLLDTRRDLENKTRETERILETLKLRDEIIQGELDIAAGIQHGTLPELPFRSEGFGVVGHYQPLGKVGGDYFDLTPLEDGSLAVLMVDVSGHGIPAALLTIMARIAFREALNQSRDPEKWLRYLNDVAEQTIASIEYMTAQCLLFPADGGPVRIANGAHRPVIHFSGSSDTIHELSAQGMILGKFKDRDFIAATSSFVMQDGDRVCLLTDGFEESRNRDGRPWGIEQLLKCLQKNWHPSLQTHMNRFLRDWEHFTRNAKQQDDCSLLMIEKKAPGKEPEA